MNKIVILYGSSEGQTAKIAHYIAEVINKMGDTAEVIDGRNSPTHFSLEPYNAAIIGTSLHAGGYQAAIRRFVQQHQQALALLPTAFFSVSLTEAYPQPEEKVHLTQLMTTFLRETGWHPQKIVSFAGALAYSKYGFFKGFVMRRIARKVGAPTDSSHDYEYTDWVTVAQFAKSFVAELQFSQKQA